MATRIVLQPNGKFALWSTVVDNFVLIDATKEELVEDMVDRFRHQFAIDVERITSSLLAGGKPYHQMTDSFDDCVDRIRETHGDECEAIDMLRAEGLL